MTCGSRSYFLLMLCLAGCVGVMFASALALNTNSGTVTDTGTHQASLVTGANGYVGREIVHSLLQNMVAEGESSHKVVCLVRATKVNGEVQYWKSRAPANTVHVMPYDMLDGGSTLCDALNYVHGNNEDDLDCDDVVVFHVASVFGPTDHHEQTALDNVKGTEDLVRSLGTYEGTRLVLTSSMAAVRGTGQEPKNGRVYTHEDWNTLSELGKNWGASYQWSKAESERKAWELTKQLKIPMVSLCPSFIFGPPSDDAMLTSSYSITLVGQWVRGESPVQSRLCVDVRDIARAHVEAGWLAPNAMGNRYIVSAERRLSSLDTAKALKKAAAAAEAEMGTRLVDPEKITCDLQFDGGAIKIGDQEVECCERIRREMNGLTFRPVEETIADMGLALLRAQQRCHKTGSLAQS